MEQKQLKDLKKNEWFTLKPYEEPRASQVWIKGEYDRSEKKYEATNWDDMNRWRSLKGTTTVYVGFTF